MVRLISSPPPKYEPSLCYHLNGEGLNHQQFREMIESPINKVVIFFGGNMQQLCFLFQQISCAKDKHIKVELQKIDIDDSICLPFHLLGPNTVICFIDWPEYHQNFYNYVLNIDSLEFNAFTLHTKLDVAERAIGERKIQIEFLKKLRDQLAKDNQTFNDYTKDQLMDSIFKHVKKKYPYDMSIVGPHGEHIPESEAGSTALGTYQRGKGICSGRSKLIKLYTNNKVLNVPCYLVSGWRGNLQHMWNEYIDERGNIIEYDASYNTICKMEDLPSSYRITDHEPDVKKILK